MSRELRKNAIALRAFTLMETLVALALLLVLVGSVFAFGMNLTSSRDRLNRHMRRSQAVRVFLDRVEQDLHTSLVGDAKHGSGIVGTSTSLQVLARGVAGMGSGQGIAVALGDLQRSEYRWNVGSGILEGSRGAVSESAPWAVVTDDLGFVQWRYHDGEQWVNQFDSAARRRLPVAVEVAIWFTRLPLEPTDELAESTPEESESGDPFSALAAAAEAGDEEDTVADLARRDWPEPDRVRLIIIPDAPDFEYGRSYDDDPDLPGESPAPNETGGTP